MDGDEGRRNSQDDAVVAIVSAGGACRDDRSAGAASPPGPDARAGAAAPAGVAVAAGAGREEDPVAGAAASALGPGRATGGRRMPARLPAWQVWKLAPQSYRVLPMRITGRVAPFGRGTAIGSSSV